MPPHRLRRALLAATLALPSAVAVQSAPAGATESPWLDTSDRAAVMAAYEAEFDRVEPASGFTGDPDTCAAGTTDAAFRESVVQRVNWYRRMAGLDTVTERAAYTSNAQVAATMMAAEGGLDHDPAPTWACYTAAGADSAGDSNLALGVNGIEAIDAYMQDPGGSNTEVGHRRTILYPQLQEVGTGDVDRGPSNAPSNVLHVFDDNLWASRPEVRETRDFVAWPPSGYVPAEATWGRWSFSLYRADFSAANVTVRDDLGLIQTAVLARVQPDDVSSLSAPEQSIVWSVGGDPDSNQLPEPTGGDQCYDITVSGVKVLGTTQADFNYTTCLLDLDFEPSNAPPGDDPPGGSCAEFTFDAWTTPCWTDQGTLGNFADVTASWQREPVAWLVANDVTVGLAPDSFGPDGLLTRAQAATLIWRMAGSPTPPSDAPTFGDVPTGSYYEQAVSWMARYDITGGTGNNEFSPDDAVTRAQFVTFLWRAVDEPTVNAAFPFSDVQQTWQIPGVRWAADAAITTGTTATTFAPDATVTRGQAAAFLYRFASGLD